MGDSIAGVRHDLLTPVNHIIGYCEILIEDAEGSGQEQVLAGLKSILEQGRHLLEEIEHALPGAGKVNEAELPALRLHLLTTLRQILDACDGMRWGANPQALAGFAEDLGRVRLAATNLIELADRIPVGPVDVPGPPPP
jgi:signal transduction histidine kinase